MLASQPLASLPQASLPEALEPEDIIAAVGAHPNRLGMQRREVEPLGMQPGYQRPKDGP